MLYILCHVFLCFDPLLFKVDIRVTCSHACMMLLAMPCLDLCALCVYFHVIWLDHCLHMLMCLDLCSQHDLCHLPCVCALHAMFFMPCAIVALLLLCLSYLCFSLSVRTQSRPYGLCHCPYTLAHIKGFGSSLLACLCLLASYALFSMLASLVLGFAMLDPLSRFVDVWLRPMLIRPCLDVTIWDASP